MKKGNRGHERQTRIDKETYTQTKTNRRIYRLCTVSEIAIVPRAIIQETFKFPKERGITSLYFILVLIRESGALTKISSSRVPHRHLHEAEAQSAERSTNKPKVGGPNLSADHLELQSDPDVVVQKLHSLCSEKSNNLITKQLRQIGLNLCLQMS